MSATISEVEATRTARGDVRYRVVVEHDELFKHQEIKGPDYYDVVYKATLKAEQWNQVWSTRSASERKRAKRTALAHDKAQKQAEAVERTEEAEAAWQEIHGILAATLSVDDTIDWETLKDRSRFDVPRPVEAPQVPDPPAPQFPVEPRSDDPVFDEPPGCFGRALEAVMTSVQEARLLRVQQRFDEARSSWSATRAGLLADHQGRVDETNRVNADLVASHADALAKWNSRAVAFHQAQHAQNIAIDALRDSYSKREAQAVSEYCELVLERSVYPDWCPKTWRLEYRAEPKLLVIEYDMPAPSALPRIKAVKYVTARDTFEESEQSAAQLEKAYDSALYQIALRTLHELFESDQADSIEAVAFNGRVNTIDPATGNPVDACVMTLQVRKAEFEAINLSAVEPKACFRKLKGVGSSKLHSLVPVAPMIELTTDDERFVESYAVRTTLDEGENLAVMDWEDFEHLIREVFELEFARTGGQVKVTRASRDGGIDVVVFDPDPLRGGKIVVQAKRYTNTVGVSAVRDLYGAVMNEGANKGILVTTSHFGPDAYEFAREKPLQLIDGGRLLHLLQQHGHKVRIDLTEAKKQLKQHLGPPE